MATKANYFSTLKNFEVIILTTEQESRASCYLLDPQVKQIDLNVNYDRSKSYFTFKNLKKVYKHFLNQRKVLNIIKPDIIISANYNFDHYWLPFITQKNIKIIKEIHASGYLSSAARKTASFLGNFKWKFNDYILSQYDAVVVLNEDEKEYQRTNNVVVIPNPIVVPNIQSDLNNKKVIAAGRIAPVKGFDQLIAAWKIINTKEPEWQLHIYGENYATTKENLQRQINENNLQEVVYFKDSVDNLPEKMLNYSIYAMSSVTECFPMVLLEALSVGMPTVSYDCPNGPRNIIQNNIDGLIVENQNPAALADGLLKIIQSESLRKLLGINAKNNSYNFATEKIMNLWLNLFEKLKNVKP